jgi:hypothetical protein
MKHQTAVRVIQKEADFLGWTWEKTYESVLTRGSALHHGTVIHAARVIAEARQEGAA